MASLSEAEYFVLFGKNDEKFCTVSKEDVLYDSSLCKGEAVPFFWDSEKLTGIVHHWGVDFGQCVRIAERLAKEHQQSSKKKASFHAGSPRRAKKKCTELLTKKVSQPATSSKAQPSKRKSKEVLKEQREDREQVELLSRKNNSDREINIMERAGSSPSGNNSDSDTSNKEPAGIKRSRSKPMIYDEESSPDGSDNESSDDEESSVSSDSNSEPEKRPSAKKQRLSAERKEKYEEEIRRLSLELKKHTEAPASSALKASSAQKPNNITPKPSSTPLMPSSASKPSTSASMSSSSASKPKGSDATYHFHIVASRTFPGQMFLHEGLSEECVELVGPKGGTGIFCGKDAYETAEAGTTATMVARRLLEGVFTEEALRSCSLTGLPPRGKGKAAYEKTEVIRPHLDAKGTKAIIDQSLEWQKAKYMRPKKEPSQIRTAISIRLCDFAKKNV